MRKLFFLVGVALFFLMVLQGGWGQSELPDSGVIRWFTTGFDNYPFVGIVGRVSPAPMRLMWEYNDYPVVPRDYIVGFKIFRNTNPTKPDTPYVVLIKDSLLQAVIGSSVLTWWVDYYQQFDKTYFYWITAFNTYGESEPKFHSHLSEVTPVTNIRGERLGSDLIKWRWNDSGLPARIHYIFRGDYTGCNRSDFYTGVERANEWIGPLISIKIYSWIDGADYGVYGSSETDFSEVGVITSVSLPQDIREEVRCYQLIQNYPNPFNPETEICYHLPEVIHVTLKVYNLLGQEIRILVDKEEASGYHAVHWDGKDAQGQDLAGGVYIYRIEAGLFVAIKKMTLMR